MKGEARKRVGVHGVTWQITVELPKDPATGKRRQKLLTAPTKKEVEALAAQMVVSIENGGFAEADAKKITVQQYLERWIASIASTVRPSTYRRYSDIVKQHISPNIGRVQLAKLTPLDVQRLYEDLLKSNLSATSVELIHCVLHRALKQALRWGLVNRNVTELVEVPRRKTPEFSVWDEAQTADFLAIGDQDELAALWRLALLTGMRRGEMLGLKWEDIDLVRGSLSVRRTLSRGADGRFEFGQPKTKQGRRNIALPESVVRALQLHWQHQVAQRRAAGTAYNDQGLVFADPLGEILHPNTVTYRFKKLAERAGIPELRLHELRHTSATLLLANNVHPKIVQERLGHANIGITLDRYSHVTQQMQQDAAKQLDKLVSRKNEVKKAESPEPQYEQRTGASPWE